MTNEDLKRLFRGKHEGVLSKLKKLSDDSHVKRSYEENILPIIEERIDESFEGDLDLIKWPPLFNYLDHTEVEKILRLNEVINVVYNNSKKERKKDVIGFLNAGPNDDRIWDARLFEAYIKFKLLENDFVVELDFFQDNGKDVDIKSDIDGEVLIIECTVLTDSDEDRRVWDSYIEEKKIDPEAVLIRPGEHDSENSLCPSPYYDTLRFYDKIFDKIAPRLDYRNAQLISGNANLIALSVSSQYGRPNVLDRGAKWAIEELFSLKPPLNSPIGYDGTLPVDISLKGYLDYKAGFLIHEGVFDEPFYRSEFLNIRNSTQKIGAISTFNILLSFHSSWKNYNHDEMCGISHKAISKLDDIFSEAPGIY